MSKMLIFENVQVLGFDRAVSYMCNISYPYYKSDSGICKGGDEGIGCENCHANDCGHTYDDSFQIGVKDHDAIMAYVKRGIASTLRKFITVYADMWCQDDWWEIFCNEVGISPYSNSYRHSTVTNYETLSELYKRHKNDDRIEWSDFIHWIESLPYSEIITEGEITL